ncbi:EpsG family protein, partial [Vibrio cholerae]|uniref:EpsG family protein n=1 Tax=Vibrio cholerae TaxID=666 RepID=UPI002270B86D
ALAIFSGSSSQGPDYQNYIWMIDRIMKESEFHSQVLAAKDVMFGIIVWIVQPENRDEYFLVILCTLLIASLHRFFLAYELGLRFFLYFPIYIILLAPGLDFAAIRSLLALSIVTIYLCFNRFRLFFILISVLSHLSIIPIWIFLSDKFQNSTYRYSKWLVGFIILFGSFSIIQFLGYLPQTETYIDLQGSWLQFFRVFSILLPLYFLAVEYDKLNEDIDLTQKLLNLSLFLSVVALGTIDVAVASNRYYEMACFFALIAIFTIK